MIAVAGALGWVAGPEAGGDLHEPLDRPEAGAAGRILLVEDNPVNQRVAAELLRRRGYEVATATNGREALEAIERALFDAVLMDIQMPEMDGLEATRRLRADARFADLPVIAMTAHAFKGDRDRCLLAGMNDYVAKPVRADQVAAVLERWIASKPSTVSPVPDAPAEPKPAAGPDDQQAVDMQAAMHNCGGIRELLDSVVATFLDSAAGHIDAIERDMRAGHWKSVARLAHNLTGSAATVGALPMRSLAVTLEGAAEEGDSDRAAALVPQLKAQLSAIRVFFETAGR